MTGMKALVLSAAAMLLFTSLPALALSAQAHEGRDGPRPPPDEVGRPFPVKFERDSFKGSPEGPMMDLFLMGGRPLFRFGAMDLDFRRGDIIERFNVSEGDWNMTFNPHNWSVGYRSNITSRFIGEPDENITSILLMFRPLPMDGNRRIQYNLTLSENLTMDSISVRWRLFPNPDEMNMTFPPEHHDWRWDERPNMMALNDTYGREMARLFWDERARTVKPYGEEYQEVNSSNSMEDGGLVLNLTLQVGSRTELIETGGYLDFLDQFLDVLRSGADEANEFLRDHLLSIGIAVAVSAVLILAVTMVLGRRPVNERPSRDLDYRSSKFFKRP